MSGFSWTLAAAAESIGGSVVGTRGLVVHSVTTDSRIVPPDSLFVAVVGERFDGHDFARDAIDAGAVAAVVERGRSDVVPRIEVDDVAEALVGLAAKRRAEITAPVIAVTGSTGKTSTKDLLAAGIEGSWASPRSYNNEVGVPLTVLATPSDATALVIEAGSRGEGNLQWLARCMQPDVSVITNLGVVHLETFGSPEGLANAKYELVEMLGPDGVAVVPADEPGLLRESRIRTLTFGSTTAADVCATVDAIDAAGRPTITLTCGGWRRTIALATAGRHQASNAAAALAAASAIGIDLDRFADGMATATGSEWRMDVHHGTFTVVNDAYNANPQSMESAMRTISQMPGRPIAVLGPMAELGSVCEREHRRIGELASRLGFAEVFVVGPDHGYGLGAPELVRKAADIDTLADTLRSALRPGDVVLVKASRSAGLERLALQLIEDASP
ncbi:MAG: UDP-N-acetylmuramoyl-tripeptide--D-alanyl-D-alanine ligase [Acidimicrobiia bacterium]